MLVPQPSQVHGGQANRCRSVSPLSRCVSAPLRSGSFTSGSNGCSSASTSGGHSTQARSSSRGRCQAGYHLSGRTSSSGGGASSSSNSRPPRSRTPPPLRAVAAPLDQQVLDPASNLDLVKVQFKCTFATSFGQELRIVGGAPELGAWDVTQAPAMTWSNGHVWMMNAFLPPGTYPFKLVVYTPGGRPESARWENGNNRSLTIEANSPELGNAALVLVDCSFDQTQHTSTQTKRITGIGFKATSLRGNPHASSSSSSSSAGPADAHPSLPSAQAIANSDSSYRASMLAAAGIPTSKVTANAGAPTQQHQHAPYQQAPVAYQQPPVAYQQPPPQQYVPPQPQQQALPPQQVQQQFVQQQYVQQQYVQQQEPAAAAPPGTSAEHMPGTEAFNHRIANLDSRLAELLSRTGRQAPPSAAPAPPSPGHAPATAHSAPGMNNVVAAPAGAAVVLPPAAPAPAAAAAPPAAPAAAAGPRVSHQPPPEVQAAAAVCKEDPAAADACRVVTKFIQEHLEMIESQALEMMMHNDRLEKRMAALEQHTQDYDDNIMQALADSLVLTPDEDLQQLPDPGPVLTPAPAAAAAAAVKPAAPAAAASSSSRAVPKAPAQAAAAAAPAAAPAAGSPGSPSSDASELVRNFMASFGSGSMLAAGQRRASAEPLAPAEGTVPVMVGDDYVIDITASQEELMTELLLEHEQQQQEEAMAAAAAAAAAAQQQQTHADLAASQAVEQLLQQEPFVPGNGSSAEAFAAALDAATPAFPSLGSDPYSLGIGAAAAGGNSSTLSQGPVPYNNPDPNWQAAHARALQWASNLVEPDSEEDEDEEDEEVPWWLKDNLPAARKTPMPIGSSSSLSSPPSSPTNSSRLRWSRARFTAPGYEQQEEEEGAEGEEGSTGRSLRRPTAAQAAFSGSAVTLATATPATAAAAAAAAAASPLVQNLQQHAYKAAKAIGQSDQAAAIAATAIASRVAFGCDPEAAAASISSPRRRRRRGSASGGSSTGGGSGSSSDGGGGIAGAMAAAIKTRQQVLAVTDVAAALAVAGDRTGTSGPPELGSAAVQGSLDAAGFDPRPESLVPTVAAGPFQLADDVLVLPSAQQIATAAGPASFLQHPQQHGEAGEPLAPVQEEEEGGTGDEEDPSDAELLQLAALQQENLMLSELASLHTRVIGLHEQAMKLEKEAHADMEHAMADTTASTASMDFDSEDEDSAGEGDELGGVLGLALKTAQRQNGSRQKHDASAVKKLMAAVQLRMEAALLQKEASEKRRALNAMRSAAAAASAATFDRHWQVGEAAQQLQQQQQQQGEEENSEDDDSDDADGGSSSDGGGGSGYGSSLELGMPASVAAASSAAATMAAATAAAPAPAPAVPSAAAAAWGTLQVQPVAAAAFTAAAPAAPAAAPAATEQPPAAVPQMLQRVRPMVPTSAVAGVMSQDEEWQHRALQQPQHSRGMQGAAAPAPAAAPVVVTALESSSWPAAASAGVPADMQEDMEAMRSKIAELRQKVSSRKNQIAALMGGASPDAVVALGAASGGAMALPAASLAVEGTGSAASILGAAAAAAAATAVAAAVPTVLAPPETPTVVEKAAQQAGAGAGPAAHLEGRSATNRADAPLKAAAVSALGGAAATAAGAAAVPSSPRGARFASRVLKSPSLVSANTTDSYQSIYAEGQQADSSAKVGRQDRLAQLQARTAAAVAAREQLSQQALEAQQALARISSSRQAAAAAAAAVGAAAGAVVAAKSARAAPAAAGAGSEPSPSDSSRAEALSQHASQAAKAVEALDHWEAQAATAKQSLEDLEQQAAAALAELQQHEATRQSGSLLRQQLMMRHKADNGWQQAIMAPVSSLGCAGPAAASPAVAGGGMAMQGVAGGVQGVCSRVPDPAAAAVITGLAAVTAVQAAGHILHDAWRL